MVAFIRMNSNKPSTYKGVLTPLPIRLLNAIAQPLKQISNKTEFFEIRNLLKKASSRTQLEDWGHQSALEALEVLLESVRREGKLTYFGRFTLRQFLIGKLCNRLRIIEALKRFPEIKRQQIRRPIFITGWYRCGTTYLYNLLATHPQSRAPLYWELMHPCPAVDPRKIKPQELIRKTKLANRIHHYLAPGFNRAHSMAAEKPEECLHLFENAGMGTTVFFITEAKSFAWWLLDRDIGPGYRFYEYQLKLLNWLRPGRRWVLKWPYHLWHLDGLLEVFPDATVIHIHRDPREAIPSVCSLAALAREPFCERIDNAALGQFWTDYNAVGWERGLASRAKAGPGQIIDVGYADLLTDPSAVIQRILDAADLEPDDPWLNSLPSGRTKKQDKNGERHQYTLSQFGLDADNIRRRFADYIETYDLES
ncbi:MAG: sulfotransferase [Desulfobacterales bacterium]